jgi:hypothetical protein
MHTPKSPFTRYQLPPDTRRSKGVFAKAVGSFVPKLAAKAFERYGFHSAEIMTAWPRVVGAEIAGFTAPERIKWPRGPSGSSGAEDGTGAAGGATLVIRVEPARALDVEYRSAEIIDRINRYFGYRAIAVLRLIQAPLLNAATNATKGAQQPPSRSPKFDATAQSGEAPQDDLQIALGLLRANVEASQKTR